jgi:hypothetical protein
MYGPHLQNVRLSRRNISGLAPIHCTSDWLTLIILRQVREQMKGMDDDDDDDDDVGVVGVVGVVCSKVHARYGRTVRAPHPQLLQLLRSVY